MNRTPYNLIFALSNLRLYNKVGYSRCATMYRTCCLLNMDRYHPLMMSLIIEVRVTSYTDFIYLCQRQGDDISRTSERIERNQPYYTILLQIILQMVAIFYRGPTSRILYCFFLTLPAPTISQLTIKKTFPLCFEQCSGYIQFDPDEKDPYPGHGHFIKILC